MALRWESAARGLIGRFLQWPCYAARKDDIESTDLLNLLQSFTAIRSLYVSKSFVPLIVPALQELFGESATEVLPSLRHLFLGRSAESGSIQEAIQPFISARQLSGQPVAVYHWEGGQRIGDSLVSSAHYTSS
jgi:hypothetical protein